MVGSWYLELRHHRTEAAEAAAVLAGGHQAEKPNVCLVGIAAHVDRCGVLVVLVVVLPERPQPGNTPPTRKKKGQLSQLRVSYDS